MMAQSRLGLGKRLILELLRGVGGRASRTSIVKWLFLVAQETDWGRENAPYDFVPYRYGAFSFVAYRDIQKLTESGLLCEVNDGLRTTVETDPRLPQDCLAAVESITKRYGSFSSEDLMRYTYRTYPWFSLLSERTDLIRVLVKRPVAAPGIYTVGYEGKSLDTFLNLLLYSGVAGVIDVRAVPRSRRYGFHRTTLCRHLDQLGLHYASHTELGITTEQRRALAGSTVRKQLLAVYAGEMVKSKMEEIGALGQRFRDRPWVLFCFEGNPAECHRSVLADILAAESGLPVVHL